MVESGDRGGQRTLPKREINRFGKIILSISIVTLALHSGAPSC